MKRVVVTRALFPEHIERLAPLFEVHDNQADLPLEPGALADLLADADGAIVTGGERIDEAALLRATRLKIIASVSVGYNHIDVAACEAKQVVVTNTPDVLTETTADFGFALMMAAARRITESERWMRDGHWKRWELGQMAGADVYGATLGILGMGRIGQAIARRARGFNMSVIYHNRRALAADIERDLGARWLPFDDLLAGADHLVVVLPYTPAVHHLIGARELSLMKQTATLTNIARGGIIDEIALAKALRDGKLAAAGLDVYEGEPAVRAELLSLSCVALTPHIASASRPTRKAMADLAIDNLIAVLNGKPALTPITSG